MFYSFYFSSFSFSCKHIHIFLFYNRTIPKLITPTGWLRISPLAKCVSKIVYQLFIPPHLPLTLPLQLAAYLHNSIWSSKVITSHPITKSSDVFLVLIPLQPSLFLSVSFQLTPFSSLDFLHCASFSVTFQDSALSLMAVLLLPNMQAFSLVFSPYTFPQ